MPKSLSGLFLIFVVSTFAAQEPKPLADAGIVTCDHPEAGGMSQWLTSRADFSAAVELRAVITGTGDQRHCITSWNLHVRGNGLTEKVIEVGQRDDHPDDNEWIEENSFDLDAWSPDGTMVLVSQIEAQGDWDETTPIIFDFRSGQHWRTELYPVFKKRIPKDCYVVYRALGFSKDGSVLISAMSTDDDREPGTRACFPESLWKLDFRSDAITRAPSSHKP